jgi:hypothetical protein
MGATATAPASPADAATSTAATPPADTAGAKDKPIRSVGPTFIPQTKN